MDANSDYDVWLTADQIAVLTLPGYPRSARRVHDKVATDGWETRLVPSQGRTGTRREYRAPADLRRLVEERTRLHDATAGNIPLHMNELAKARMREAAGALAPGPADPDLAPFGTSLNVETVRPSSELQAKAIFALMDMSEIPPGLTLDQRTALTMRLFDLLMMSCGSDAAKLKRVIETPDALKGALRLAWELYRSDI